MKQGASNQQFSSNVDHIMSVGIATRLTIRRIAIAAAMIVLILVASCGKAEPMTVPSPTPVFPTATSVPPTATPVLPTATPVPPTVTPIPPTSARFEPAECQFRLPPGEKVECGYLLVPEDRSQADSSTIRLHIAVVKSHSDAPKPDPVVYLAGGPGRHALDSLLWSIEYYAGILKDRDLVVFDQRGIGYSRPSLDCPELTELLYETLDEDLGNEEWVERTVEANLACRDRLVREGINLAAYNSLENAADVNDLRLVLGYAEWNLLGVSYGTRLAQVVMRDFPQGVRSVVLDSVLPLQVDAFATLPTSAYRSANLIFERCAADEKCNAAFPELETAYDELVEQLEAAPVSVQVQHLFTNKKYRMLINGMDMSARLVDMLYDTDAISWLPKVIFDAREGNFRQNKQLSEALRLYLISHDFLSEGMHYSVMCGEEAAFSSLETALAASAGVYPRLRDYSNGYLQIEFSTCDAWGAKKADSIENEAVTSDIPSLVLMGEYDPVTPPAWGRMMAETLDSAYYVEFPGTSHGVFSDRWCARDIVVAFLDDPGTEPNTGCAGGTKVNFVTP